MFRARFLGGAVDFFEITPLCGAFVGFPGGEMPFFEAVLSPS